MNKRRALPDMPNEGMKVIPLGYHLVMTGAGKDDQRGNLVIVAVPDEMIDHSIQGEDPVPAQFQKAIDMGAPMTILHFKDVEAVESFKARLDQLAEGMKE